jgi:hypothetical protein
MVAVGTQPGVIPSTGVNCGIANPLLKLLPEPISLPSSRLELSDSGIRKFLRVNNITTAAITASEHPQSRCPLFNITVNIAIMIRVVESRD